MLMCCDCFNQRMVTKCKEPVCIDPRGACLFLLMSIRTARALHAHCTPCRTPVEVCRFNVWVAVWLGQTVSVHVFKCPVFKRAVSGVQCSQLTADTLV